MKKLTFKIETTGAAFNENACEEVARILRDLADRVGNYNEDDDQDYPLFDMNGNLVGIARQR